jgi:[NiFe] hydrogenase diaphorase moiety large subunit
MKFPEIYSDRLRQPTGDLLPSFDVGAALGGYAMAMEQLAVQESK